MTIYILQIMHIWQQWDHTHTCNEKCLLPTTFPTSYLRLLLILPSLFHALKASFALFMNGSSFSCAPSGLSTANVQFFSEEIQLDFIQGL